MSDFAGIIDLGLRFSIIFDPCFIITTNFTLVILVKSKNGSARLSCALDFYLLGSFFVQGFVPVIGWQVIPCSPILVRIKVLLSDRDYVEVC